MRARPPNLSNMRPSLFSPFMVTSFLSLSFDRSLASLPGRKEEKKTSGHVPETGAYNVRGGHIHRRRRKFCLYKKNKRLSDREKERESTTKADLLASFNLEAQSGTLWDFILAPK